MAAPDDDVLLLWRGILLGSDALWKLKQRSVTQLSVVFFFGEYKKYTVSGVTFFFKFEEIVVHLWIVKMKFSSHLIGPKNTIHFNCAVIRQ